MSFDIFVQPFRDGGPGVADVDAVRAILAPFVAEQSSDLSLLETADGKADLHGFDDLQTGFMANHIAGMAAWDLIVRAAASCSLVIMPAGCPVALTNRSSYLDLPPELQSMEVAVVATGAELLSLIEERTWACPVCFAPELTARPYAEWPPDNMTAMSPPYEDVLGLPSYEVCPNCGFEFGNDDNPGTALPTSFEEHRQVWEANGRPRFWTNDAIPIKDPDREHPIAHAWQPTLRTIVSRIVAGDYQMRDIPGVAPLSQDDGLYRLRDGVANYGEVSLTELPDATWHTSVAIWGGSNYWDVLVDLYTIEEGRSDLVLGARVTEVEAGYSFTVEMIYVP